jgi:hypothetical protein
LYIPPISVEPIGDAAEAADGPTGTTGANADDGPTD